MKENSANVTLKIGDVPVRLTVTVPNKRTKQDILLPFLRELDQKSEDIAIANVTARGHSISCTNGCSACCYQLIPLNQIEVRYIVKFIERMPKNSRQKIQNRFAEAYTKIQDAGILDDLMNSGQISENLTEFALKYFDLGIACPFLEDNSCSIYKERPLRCREYLVTNPAIHCAKPTKETIQLVPFPVRMSKLLSKLNQPWTKYATHWVPLSLLLAWEKCHPEPAILRHSKEWVEDALNALG